MVPVIPRFLSNPAALGSYFLGDYGAGFPLAHKNMVLSHKPPWPAHSWIFSRIEIGERRISMIFWRIAHPDRGKTPRFSCYF
ncbi:hypothetical protein DFR59_10671 [Falsibacillus pallidus]|uniref:Uncharacterized protein n=1 Tax=Falsibacillus pallidus TaxID=493781 RepID=A0A370GDN2_9BACI|nr:hypothetical protein DFR59_10671 [Falsibacillus pallidus]